MTSLYDKLVALAVEPSDWQTHDIRLAALKLGARMALEAAEQECKSGSRALNADWCAGRIAKLRDSLDAG